MERKELEVVQPLPTPVSLPKLVTAKEAEPSKPVKTKKQVLAVLDDGSVDYSHLYTNFYDIFTGFQLDPKNFNLNFQVRETRSVFASFVNLMESNALLMNQKVKFDLHPLEKGYKDHLSNYNVPNHFTLVGKNLNEMELEIESRDREEMMMAAQGQVQLREKYQQMKGKDEKQIVRDALEKTAATGPFKDRQSSLYFRVIKNRSEVYDIITRSFSRKKRWNELPHGLDLRNSWNLIWTWSKMNADITKLLVWQRTNHFIGAKNVSRKDFLKVNIERARKVSTKSN